MTEAKINGLGAGKSDLWQTPLSVFNALQIRFDLDVAAPINGPLRVPADAWLYEESLDTPWFGCVWMNPPFGGRGALEPWLDKFFRHGNGVALTPDRTSAPWFRDAWDRTDAILFVGRTPFLLPDGKKGGNPAFGTTLWAVGDTAVEAFRRAAAGNFGKLVVPEKQS